MPPSEDKFRLARITQRREVAHDLWSVRLKPEGDFNFLAGQYATLGVRTAEGHIERAYSLVSSPYEGEIEVFVELVPDGEFTPLFHELLEGSSVTLRKIAKGHFTIDLKSGHPNHLLLCTVTGVAPFISYVRTLYRDWNENHFPGEFHLYLIHGASRSSEFGYREELERTASEVPWLTYVPTISRPWEDAAWQGETGRVEDVIRKYVDQWGLTGAGTTAYLCGHPHMVKLAIGILERRGFGKLSLKKEAYWVPSESSQS